MTKYRVVAGLSLLATFLPAIAFAQFGNIDTTFTNINTFIGKTLIPFIVVLGVLVFSYGMYKYFILGGTNESERAKGGQLLLYTVIALVLVTAIWGIVAIISSSTGLTGQKPPAPPYTFETQPN